ncbi:MAG: carbohydrate kinase, partial [Saprospiraceae bacterium]|nr:carbohydrate kinase [Saprospiraceae bacterium]
MLYLIGVDIGTTNVKAVAIAENDRVIAQASRPTQLLSPFPGASEQSPLDLLRKVATVIRAVQRSAAGQGQVAGLIFSGAMHSLMLQDTQNAPLSNAWLWSDLRAATTGKVFRQTASGAAVYQRTGTPLHAMS